jgi:hypothetical protein
MPLVGWAELCPAAVHPLWPPPSLREPLLLCAQLAVAIVRAYNTCESSLAPSLLSFAGIIQPF